MVARFTSISPRWIPVRVCPKIHHQGIGSINTRHLHSINFSVRQKALEGQLPGISILPFITLQGDAKQMNPQGNGHQ